MLEKEIITILLKDKTTKKFIRWATDNYISLGQLYMPNKEILPELIMGLHSKIIQPRVSKTFEEKSMRTRNKAEVFSPAWICNKQNNLIDMAWFGKKDVFNIECKQCWTTNKQPITFDENKTWEKYVYERRLEICCGEAPYLVSRYDAVSGEYISIEERIGILDRKIRVINENVNDENEWVVWVIRAYQSTYGYEYQGDNLILARKNLLYTFIDNMMYKFGHKPSLTQLKKIANIIAWNIWQMDGMTMNVPYNTKKNNKVEAIPCRIFDWISNQSIEFKSIIKGMK